MTLSDPRREAQKTINSDVDFERLLLSKAASALAAVASTALLRKNFFVSKACAAKELNGETIDRRNAPMHSRALR